MKVLIVDDYLNSATAISDLLEANGFESEISLHGKSAIKRAKKEEFFVVLCDIFMPDFSGFDFLSSIKEIRPELPIIFITGHSDFDSAVTALNEGAVGFILKPVNPTELINRVEQLKKLYEERRDRDLALQHIIHEVHEMEFLTSTLLDKDNLFSVVNYLVKQFTTIYEIDGLKFKLAIAITEVIQNALEHGNLEVPSHLRETYGSEGFDRFEKMIEERANDPAYNSKKIFISYLRSQTGVTLTVRDEGKGFNHKEKMAHIKSGEVDLEKCYGRGLMIANSYMDDIHFNKKGNEITLKHLFKN
ncbi:MAG: response regulator [Nitrospinae bacterium]|nr:response regulator [Nitrospinota bacterium]